MPNSPISQMLEAWEKHLVEHHPQVSYEIDVCRDDVFKLEALAELYGLPLEDIIANLISSSLKEVEQKMPYKKGSRVIRIEEGDPVYEDVGQTPRYLEIKRRLEQQSQKLAG
ncbi:hypothetical protein DV711_10715 [Motiliproteus coralliicola]|uniref:Type 1 pili tip component n=1 Tax=Motiliproteus coralliicola TaxID=2283196 RepID=A0A369WPM1_9GAMM|nr:hypothetical protein [Motiliproteus coralliicola]RDE23009.1 hypothetical protein DV711_10715 [Motiliproteus coralliicola]